MLTAFPLSLEKAAAERAPICECSARPYQHRTVRFFYRSKPLEDYPVLDYRKEVMLVPQQVFLFDGTIRENFDLFYDMREEKQPLDEDVQRFLSICCADFPLSANCATLSGGERQRVFLAIFLSAMPKVLLLDEPTAALDEQTSETLLHNLKQFCSQNNISVVCVCHNGELVRRFADQEIRLGEE